MVEQGGYQAPRPEDHDAAQLHPRMMNEKTVGEIIIPGQEKALRQGANKTIAGVHKFLKAQVESERLAELAKKAVEKTNNGGTQRVFDAISKNPGRFARAGKFALGPAFYAATEIAAAHLDTTMADTLNAVGDAHFNAARRALADVQNEEDPLGKDTHRRTAEGALRDAYDLYEADLAARDGKTLPKTAQIEAHLRATEVSLLIAAINRMDPHTQAAVPTWAENARLHHNDYLSLAHEAAQNGITLSNVGGFVAVVAEAQPYIWPLQVLRGKRSYEEIFPLTNKANERVEHHEKRLRELPEEQKEFYEVYLQFVQPQQPPTSERRELT